MLQLQKNLPYTHGITLKRVMSDEVHRRSFAFGQHSSRRRVVAVATLCLTGAVTEPSTSRADNDVSILTENASHHYQRSEESYRLPDLSYCILYP